MYLAWVFGDICSQPAIQKSQSTTNFELRFLELRETAPREYIWKLYFVCGLKIFLPNTRILRTMPNQNLEVSQ